MAVTSLPPELREHIYSFLVHGSTKNEQFKKDLQETWLKFQLKRRIQKTMADNATEDVLLETEQLLRDIDEIEMSDEEFRHQLYNEVFKFIQRWTPRFVANRWLFFADEYDEANIIENIGDNYIRYIRKGEMIIGYLLLREENSDDYVDWLLSGRNEFSMTITLPFKLPCITETDYDDIIENMFHGDTRCEHGNSHLRDMIYLGPRVYPFIHKSPQVQAGRFDAIRINIYD